MGGISENGSLFASLRSAKCPVVRPDASVRAKRAPYVLKVWGPKM